MTVDILIFSGQSNMQGQTEGCPSDNQPVPMAYEYRHQAGVLVPLRHPVGETFGDLLLAAHEGGGSLVPDFCRRYAEKSGVGVVAIHVARGATKIAEWQSDTARYRIALEKIEGGIRAAKEAYSVRHIYLVWLQGESDAIDNTPPEQYRADLIRFKNDLKSHVPLERFGIIEVGYFCQGVSWLSEPDPMARRKKDEAIMQVQEALPSLDADFLLLTDCCKTLSLSPAHINPKAEGHYNNRAMTEIGYAAADGLLDKV